MYHLISNNRKDILKIRLTSLYQKYSKNIFSPIYHHRANYKNKNILKIHYSLFRQKQFDYPHYTIKNSTNKNVIIVKKTKIHRRASKVISFRARESEERKKNRQHWILLPRVLENFAQRSALERLERVDKDETRDGWPCHKFELPGALRPEKEAFHGSNSPFVALVVSLPWPRNLPKVDLHPLPFLSISISLTLSLLGRGRPPLFHFRADMKISIRRSCATNEEFPSPPPSPYSKIQNSELIRAEVVEIGEREYLE